jgi:hypothetical protein
MMRGEGGTAMGSDDELWRLEERFWLDGADFHTRTLAPDALMVLPPPAGVLDRAASVESIRSAARWRRVDMDQRRHAQVSADTAILAYVAKADRGGSDAPYEAQCGSTYVRVQGRWLLALHQQTPLGQAGGAGA